MVHDERSIVFCNHVWLQDWRDNPFTVTTHCPSVIKMITRLSVETENSIVMSIIYFLKLMRNPYLWVLIYKQKYFYRIICMPFVLKKINNRWNTIARKLNVGVQIPQRESFLYGLNRDPWSNFYIEIWSGSHDLGRVRILYHTVISPFSKIKKHISYIHESLKFLHPLTLACKTKINANAAFIEFIL